jgi:serine phosphatase RsbU (regulator of sigma subunit)
MEYAAKIYARKILAIHFALLILLLAIVSLAAHSIYVTARQEAVDQASRQQELLASQTARGIEGFYTSLLSDLDLVQRSAADEAPETSAPAARARAQGQGQRTPLGPRFFVPILWNQLAGRATALFRINLVMKDPAAAVFVFEPRPADQTQKQAKDFANQLQLLADESKDWLYSVKRPSVSRLLPLSPDSPVAPGNTAVNLVAVPIAGTGRLLVAVVPAGQLQTRFLPNLTERKLASTSLLDDDLQIVVSTSTRLLGANLKLVDDASVRQLIEQLPQQQNNRTRTIDRPLNITGSVLEPSLVTLEPLTLPDSTWGLLCTSSLNDVDDVVRDEFKGILYWAIFLVVSMTAVLVSTAWQMIRGRVRLERIQHEVLSREMTQAREIQLNWLPKSSPTGLDVCAINQPASHVSGDFYNWFDLPDGRHAVTIGDVTGHGMSAAFLMATTQLLVRTTMPRVCDPGVCLTEVNRQLCTQVFHGQFVTMLIVLIDEKKGVLEIATAGHASPLVSEDGHPFTSISLKAQLVLAIDPEQVYPTERFRLTGRCNLLLYTDGVLDAQSPDENRFSSKGLKDSLNGTFKSAKQILDTVVEAVTQFRGTRQLADDLTLVAICTQHQVKESRGHETDAALQKDLAISRQ